MLDKLTLKDFKEIRDYTGKSSINEIFAPLTSGDFDLDGIEGLQALIYVVRKKTDPNYTIEEAAELTLEEMQAIFSGVTDAPLPEKSDTDAKAINETSL